jgi:2-polyprenyl-3-methyl-5-hydroxy-6-metoxy-1,4-benzoquinol methylase
MRLDIVAESDSEREALAQGKVHAPFFFCHAAVIMARTLTVASKLHVFDAIASGADTVASIAHATECSAAAMHKLLTALEGLRCVRREGEHYSLMPYVSPWLLKDASSSILDFVLSLETCEWSWFTQLEKFMRSGESAQVHEHLSDDQWHKYQRGMRALSGFVADELVERIALPAGSRRMLDVGGSQGFFSIAFCRRSPQLMATVIELRGAVEQGRPWVAAQGFAERVEHVAADARTVELAAEQYDFVLISHLAHHLTAEQNADLVARATRALRPGGILAIQEGIRTEQESQVGQIGALIDLFCAVVSGSGCWSVDEIALWTQAAGLKNGQALWLKSAPGVAVYMARKPLA